MAPRVDGTADRECVSGAKNPHQQGVDEDALRHDHGLPGRRKAAQVDCIPLSQRPLCTQVLQLAGEVECQRFGSLTGGGLGVEGEMAPISP